MCRVADIKIAILLPDQISYFILLQYETGQCCEALFVEPEFLMQCGLWTRLKENSWKPVHFWQLLFLKTSGRNKTSKWSFKFCLQHEASTLEWGNVKLQLTLLINGNLQSYNVTPRKNGHHFADGENGSSGTRQRRLPGTYFWGGHMMGGPGGAGLWIQNMNAHPSVIPPPDTHLWIGKMEEGTGVYLIFLDLLMKQCVLWDPTGNYYVSPS